MPDRNWVDRETAVASNWEDIKNMIRPGNTKAEEFMSDWTKNKIYYCVALHEDDIPGNCYVYESMQELEENALTDLRNDDDWAPVLPLFIGEVSVRTIKQFDISLKLIPTKNDK